MIVPFCLHSLLLPLLDWGAASLQALEHVACGTLCTDPAWNPLSEDEE